MSTSHGSLMLGSAYSAAARGDRAPWPLSVARLFEWGQLVGDGVMYPVASTITSPEDRAHAPWPMQIACCSTSGGDLAHCPAEHMAGSSYQSQMLPPVLRMLCAQRTRPCQMPVAFCWGEARRLTRVKFEACLVHGKPCTRSHVINSPPRSTPPQMGLPSTCCPCKRTCAALPAALPVQEATSTSSHAPNTTGQGASACRTPGVLQASWQMAGPRNHLMEQP